MTLSGQDTLRGMGRQKGKREEVDENERETGQLLGRCDVERDGRQKEAEKMRKLPLLL